MNASSIPTTAGVRRAALLVALLLASGVSSACSTLRATVRGYELGPGGIARPQHRLRLALSSGDFVRALAWREDDALLERLTRATSAYYAGQFLRAGALLDTAALMSDDRVTERLGRDAIALVTNDLARPYRPRRTERLFIPYYGMLAFARAERWEDAAVEARRLAALLATQEEGRDAAEQPLHAALEHVAGAVLERAGLTDEAEVAYRAAHRMLAGAPELRPLDDADDGELLVVLERGFVAHRVTERIDVRVDDDHDGDERDPRHSGEESTGAPNSEGARQTGDPRHPTSASSVPTAGGTFTGDSVPHRHRRRHRDRDDDLWVAIAFPVLRASGRPWGASAQMSVDDALGEAVRIAAVVDEASEADERRDRLAMLARATARAGAKYVLAKTVKDKKGETAGTLANYGASLLERADVRSWHLLPQELQLIRVRMPAGTHPVRVRVIEGGRARTLELGSLTVHPGRLTIAPVRVWAERPAATVMAAR